MDNNPMKRLDLDLAQALAQLEERFRGVGESLHELQVEIPAALAQLRGIAVRIRTLERANDEALRVAAVVADVAARAGDVDPEVAARLMTIADRGSAILAGLMHQLRGALGWPVDLPKERTDG